MIDRVLGSCLRTASPRFAARELLSSYGLTVLECRGSSAWAMPSRPAALTSGAGALYFHGCRDVGTGRDAIVPRRFRRSARVERLHGARRCGLEGGPASQACAGGLGARVAVPAAGGGGGGGGPRAPRPPPGPTLGRA